jgi:hypothetical protein
MRALVAALVAGAWLVVSIASAHGPQIQITRDDNQIIMRRLLREAPYSSRLTAPTSVYVIPLIATEGIWYSRPNNIPSPTVPGAPEYLSGPGVAYGYDQADGGPRDFDAGQHFELKLIDGLKWWDGSAFVDPGLEEIEAFRSTGSPAQTTDGLTPATPVTLAFSNVSATYNDGAHSNASFRLIGAPPNAFAPTDDGVYLLSMIYDSTEPGLEASEPFYFLLHKNAQSADILAAAGGLNVASSLVQYVPEPGAAVFLTLGACFVAASCRRGGRRQS